MKQPHCVWGGAPPHPHAPPAASWTLGDGGSSVARGPGLSLPAATRSLTVPAEPGWTAAKRTEGGSRLRRRPRGSRGSPHDGLEPSGWRRHCGFAIRLPYAGHTRRCSLDTCAHVGQIPVYTCHSRLTSYRHSRCMETYCIRVYTCIDYCTRAHRHVYIRGLVWL